MHRFEVSYLKANDPIKKRALWIREQRMCGRVWRWCVLTDPGWGEARVWGEDRHPGACPRESGGEPGSINSGCRLVGRHDGFISDLSFDLNWDTPAQPFRILPWWMYRLPFQTKYESVQWNGRISGTLRFPSPLMGEGQSEGETQKWTITRWPAQQGHLWGWRMSQTWAWAHGNCFVEDPAAAFEILTSGGRTVLCLKSQQFKFAANTCANWRSTRHDIAPTHWNWEFAHKDLKITGRFRLGYAELVALDFPAPQGGTRRCHNTKVGCGVIAVSRAGRPFLQLTAHDTLAWEYVGSL